MSRHVCHGLILAAMMVLFTAPTASGVIWDMILDSLIRPAEVQTSTSYSVGQPEIQQLPTRGYESIVILQPGVVIDHRYGSVHIRGGGATDADYYVDGISQRDGFTGQSIARVSNNTLKSITLESGAFCTEYGNVMSGVVGVRTIEGGSQLHGTIEASTDNFHGDNYDYNIYSVALNGPLIPNSDKLTFSAAGERLWFGYGGWNWQGKLRWRPSEAVTARFGTIGSEADWCSVPRSYYFNWEHAPRTKVQNNSFWGEVKHAPNENVWYSVRGSSLSHEGKTGDGTHFDNLWGYGRPGNGNYYNESADLFRSWDDLNIDAEGNQIVTPTYDSILIVPMFEDNNYNGVIDDGEDVYFGGEPIEQSFIFNFDRVDSIRINEFGDEVEYTTTFADEGHVWEDYEAYKSSSVNGRFDLAANIATGHRVQAGAEFRRHTLRYYRHYFPNRIYLGASGGFDDINSYGYDVLGRETDDDLGLNDAKHPIDMGGYVQDRFKIGKATVSAGVRIDRFDYDALVLRDLANPLDPDRYADPEITPNPTDSQLVEANRLTACDMHDAEIHTSVSPRLSVAYPVRKGTTVRMSAGRFYERPDLRDLYANTDYLEFKVKTGGYYVSFGNGNLDPMETSLFEVGIYHRHSPEVSVGVSGYYKDMANFVTVANQPAAPTSYATIVTGGEATVKGVEIDVDLRAARGLMAQLKYGLQDASGEGYRDTRRNVAWTVSNPTPASGPLLYEQRHKFTAIVDLRAGRGEGPRWGEMYPLERAGVNIVVMVASGFPYTPSRIFNEVTLGNASPVASGPINSERAPSTFRIDLKANKMIPLARATFDLYFWILNVLDRDNPIDVYASSGRPDETGWLDTRSGEEFIANNSTPTDVSGLTGEQKYRLRQNDPANFGTPRQIRFGARLLF